MEVNFEGKRSPGCPATSVRGAAQGALRGQRLRGSVRNAGAALEVQRKLGSFDAYIWRFVGGRPIHNTWKRLKDIPTTSRESDAMSRDLKKRSFTFVGSTICYAFIQAVAMVNDHTTNCFRYAQLVKGQ